MADHYRDRPFQTDEDDRRYSNAPAKPSDSDPLAELARLIGQTDPFSSFSRNHPQPSSRDHAGHAPDDGYGSQDSDPQYGHDDTPASTPAWVQRRSASAAPSFARGQEFDDPYAQPDANDRFRQRDDFRPDSFRAPAQTEAPRGRNPQSNGSRYDDVLYGQEQPDQSFDPRYANAQPRFDSEPFGDERYSDETEEAPSARRGGMATVVVVLALAVLGTAGAYAYRSLTGSPRSGEPPVFKADTGPNKIVPPGSGETKLSYDRVGDKAAERVVSREEKPVDIGTGTSPRVVFPPLTPNSNPPTSSAVSTTTRPTGNGVGNGTVSGEEPRRIRTLTIRPDQPDVAASPAIAPSASAPSARLPAPPRAVTPFNTASSNASANASANGNGPISLTPQTQSQQTAPDPRSRVASINPAVQTPSAGGSFVQISSQKNEADAQASFRAMQSKYPGMLASRTPSIRRADLGDKGVYYRAMVGPFASTDEATQFCVNLKSAGGQCIVQRN